MRATGRGESVRLELSRRRFGQGAAATAIVVGLGGPTTFTPAFADGRARSFGAEFDPSVWVRMGDGAAFTVEVIGADDGVVLERYEGLDLKALLKIRSDLVRFYPARPGEG